MNILNVCTGAVCMNKKEINRKLVGYEQMYEAYYQSVYAFVRSHIHQVEAAQDLTADVFMAAYRNWEKFDPQVGSIATWLYCITRNRLKNYYRSQRDLVSIEELQERGELQLLDGNQVQRITELRDALARILESLPDRNRQIVVLRYFGGKSNQEIAEIMEMSHENVRVTLTRTLKKMQDLLKENGFDLEE